MSIKTQLKEPINKSFDQQKACLCISFISVMCDVDRKSVPRVTFRYHEAICVVPNSVPDGGIFLSAPHVQCLSPAFHLTQCIFDSETRNKRMFTEARAFSRVTYFLFSGKPAGFFLKLT